MSRDQDFAYYASLVFALIASCLFGLAAEWWLVTAGAFFAWSSLNALVALHAHTVDKRAQR